MVLFLLEKENFNPRTKCVQNEIECKNSYGYKICVQEKTKKFACAKYLTELCDEDKFIADSALGKGYVSINKSIF